MPHYRKIMNPREEIENNKKWLVDSIDVKNTTLWERLIELKLFTSSDVQHIKVGKSLFLLDTVNPNCRNTILNI